MQQLFKRMGPPPTLLKEDGNQESSKEEARWSPELDWELYFTSRQDLTLPGTQNTFRVYFSQGPGEGPLFVLLHGGGHSALSWAATVKALGRSVRAVALDLRGHGDTHTDDDSDLSMETLTRDTIALIRALSADAPSSSIILVGHSLGGSLAVHVAISGQIRELCGLVVVDVVEGTAMASLNYMEKYLANMPSSFPSLEKAIQWTVQSGSVHNLSSARVSVPPRLVRDDSTGHYVWRTDLNATKHYWEGWYQGMSKKFLSCPATKVLILAGTDRLDTELMIGQMQGKFRVVILPDCGHCVPEDNPEKTAEILMDLKKRFELVRSTIPDAVQ